MRANSKITKFCLAAFAIFQIAIPPHASGGEMLGRLKRLFGESTYHGTAPKMGQDCSIECLAENIDWLEHHIDNYGSVVAKQPDIWGEARLTKHRDEYERILFGELNQFKYTINAAISQSDSSFAAQAIALSNAANGTSISPTNPDPNNKPVAVANAILVSAKDIDANKFEQFRVSEENPKLEPGVQLEPTVFLDQMSRYLKHLHELRRINEGDDTSDSPGYSMNLVRIPVSILPGKLTREGFGAEITITAEPVISEDLLPTTFHNLVVNDVVDQLGLPLVRVTESLGQVMEASASRVTSERFRKMVSAINDAREEDLDGFVTATVQSVRDVLNDKRATEATMKALIGVAAVGGTPEENALPQPSVKTRSMSVAGRPRPSTEQSIEQAKINSEIREILESVRARRQRKAVSETFNPPSKYLENSTNNESPTRDVHKPDAEKYSQERKESALAALIDDYTQANQGKIVYDREVAENWFVLRSSEEWETVNLYVTYWARQQLEASLVVELGRAASIITPTGRTRRAANPLNPSSLEPVLDIDNIAIVAEAFDQAYYGRSIRWNGGPKPVSGGKPCKENRVDLLDARKYLEAELHAAYELLSQPKHIGLFAQLAGPQSGLSEAIRSGHFELDTNAPSPPVANYRNLFFRKLHQHTDMLESVIVDAEMLDCVPGSSFSAAELLGANESVSAESSVEALAWAIVVESALLNERLNQDVRKLAKAKGVPQLAIETDRWFFLPDTVMTPGQGLEPLQGEYHLALQTFEEYVRCRWPIHVFAVDPVAQDQNVADVSQRRRELQFALALGFASGQIGANSLTQFSRELESQIETVSLNRTIVGFGHGADTFGWRFYPRVQALDTPGTFGAICETLTGTSRDKDLKHRQLESGQRECVAVVLMPSFVPYADFDIRSNWFKLTNPKNSALTMKDGVKLSRAVTAMRNSRAQCSECQHLYREGELRRLFKRVDQLDRELPLQTQRALVPYENTLGGFEMFNTGVTDLSPELIGWYGAPGIVIGGDYKCGCYSGCSLVRGECTSAEECTKLNAQLIALKSNLDVLKTDHEHPLPACEGSGTTLFLVGDNFSVHDTKVIAGGVCIPHVRLISRELMQVTIPPCVNTVKLCENGLDEDYVSIYVATPYGVGNHLHVPVHTRTPKAAADKTTVTAVTEALRPVITEQVAQAVSSDRPPHPLVSITAEKPVRIVATCIDSARSLMFQFEGNEPHESRYSVAGSASLRNKIASLRVAVMSGSEFLGPAVPVDGFELGRDCGTFNTIGDQIIASNNETLKQLRAIKYTDIKDKPLELKLVFFASFNDQTELVRLADEIQLIVQLGQCDCANLSEAGTIIKPKSVPPVGRTEVRNLPPPCGCTQLQAPINHQGLTPIQPISYRSDGVQFRLAQQRVPSVVDTVPPETIAEFVTLQRTMSQQLEEIKTRMSVIENEATSIVETSLPVDSPTPSDYAELIRRASQPTTIQVRVDAPQSVVPAQQHARHHDRDYPMLNRMKVGVGEHWRNLRDQLPCN